MLSSDEDEDSDQDQTSMKINTLSVGYTLHFPAPMTKAEIIKVCEDLEGNTGGEKEESRWEPVRDRMGLRWTRWPKMEAAGEDGVCLKEMRVTRKAYARCARTKAEGVPWPVLEGDARELWKEDFSPCVQTGKYMTEFVAFGTAPAWTRREAGMIRDALIKRGVRVSACSQVRHLCYERCSWRRGK
jgi:hypothetical protein